MTSALILYTLFFIYMFFYIPATNPMWSKGVAEQHIQSATTLQELQTDLRSAVGGITRFQRACISKTSCCSPL